MSSQLNDWGLLYGFSLYETIWIHNGAPCWLDRHIGRLRKSARALDFNGVPDEASLASAVFRHAEACGHRERVVRLTATGGNPDRGIPPQVFVTDRAMPYSEDDYANGFDVTIHDQPRSEQSPLVRHKTGNQMENILAWRSARRRGFHEAVFLNTRGFVAEGTRSNIFVVSKTRVVTPPVDAGILPGLARERTLVALRELGLNTGEQNIALSELRSCDECFLTNSIMNAMPVRRIGDATLAINVAPAVRARLIEEAERTHGNGMRGAAC